MRPDPDRLPDSGLYHVVNERYGDDRDDHRDGKHHHCQLEAAREAFRAVSGFLKNRHCLLPLVQSQRKYI